MNRSEIHAELDKQLDDWGYKDRVVIPYGSISLQINFVDSRPEITIRERETKKPRVAR